MEGRMHSANLAAHIKQCFPFTLHWACSRRVRVKEIQIKVFFFLFLFFSQHLNGSHDFIDRCPDLKLNDPSSFREAKLNLQRETSLHYHPPITYNHISTLITITARKAFHFSDRFCLWSLICWGSTCVVWVVNRIKIDFLQKLKTLCTLGSRVFISSGSNRPWYEHKTWVHTLIFLTWVLCSVLQ